MNTVTLNVTRLSRERISQIKTQLPKCKIVYSVQREVAWQWILLGASLNNIDSQKKSESLLFGDFEVNSLKLEQEKFLSNDIIETLGELPALEDIHISKATFEDPSLRPLQTSASLRTLRFFQTNVDDTAIETFTALRQLSFLALVGTTFDHRHFEDWLDTPTRNLGN